MNRRNFLETFTAFVIGATQIKSLVASPNQSEKTIPKNLTLCPMPEDGELNIVYLSQKIPDILTPKLMALKHDKLDIDDSFPLGKIGTKFKVPFFVRTVFDIPPEPVLTTVEAVIISIVLPNKDKNGKYPVTADQFATIFSDKIFEYIVAQVNERQLNNILILFYNHHCTIERDVNIPDKKEILSVQMKFAIFESEF